MIVPCRPAGWATNVTSYIVYVTLLTAGRFTQRLTVLGADEQRDLVRECVEEWQKKEGPRAKQSVLELLEPEDSHEQASTDDDIIRDSLDGGDGKSQKKGVGENEQLVTYFLNFIRKSKAANKPPNAFLKEHRAIYQCYVNYLKSRSVIDFNDMIPYTMYLFRKRPDVLKECQQKFRFLSAGCAFIPCVCL
jgi:superfamily I DNA/RNA helicase